MLHGFLKQTRLPVSGFSFSVLTHFVLGLQQGSPLLIIHRRRVDQKKNPLDQKLAVHSGGHPAARPRPRNDFVLFLPSFLPSDRLSTVNHESLPPPPPPPPSEFLLFIVSCFAISTQITSAFLSSISATDGRGRRRLNEA